MAVIEVNHQTLRSVADAVDTYCEAQDREMRSADSAVGAMLLTDWAGDDAREFGTKWNQIDSECAVTTQLKKSLKNFGNALRACASEYQKAQEDSYNAAYYLPRW